MIEFYTEDIDYKLPQAEQMESWLQAIAKREGLDIEALSFIFCSDAYLLPMNQEYLQHDTLTDVITFQYQEEGQPVSGDIFISVERCRENAEKFEVLAQNEIHRVMAHGLLHLLGYKDKSKEEAQLMRQKENESLELLAQYAQPNA
ncbi:metalloprotein, YbeY/UPF0054 family [Saprospira grandis DSM 2844]|uniref:Endoribonuclease YbeY n=1 Tax=Saprospira grandis DSM 2844 TaxID=694433 RepID=J0P6P2_9BACT|nr:rRNA maturation RNase YbeY [Saprospira grandis]EJF53147.1 metalloprotein, YbeY/UPF0054 family [Saprospira grandis DSM 2844]